MAHRRRTRWALLLLALLGGAPAVAAPGTAADSLRHALRTAPTDTARALTALRLSIALAATDTARAGQYARQALSLSTTASFGYGQAHGWLQLSALALIRHDNARADRYSQRAEAIAGPLFHQHPATRLRKLLGAVANNRGNVADRRGAYAAATRFYLQAADYLEALPASTTLLTVYANLGNSFLVLSQPARAARYWRQAAALRARTGPVPELLPVYLQLATLHLQRTQPDSAWQQLQFARSLLSINTLYAGEFYGTLGQYYLLVQQPEPAGQALHRALGYAERKGAAGYQAQLLGQLGQLEAQRGDLGHARSSLQRSLALTAQLGDPQQLVGALGALAQLEEEAGQWRAALRYTQRAHGLRDSLAGTAVRQQAQQLEARYRSRQQAQQLAALRQAQAAQALVLRQQRRLAAVYLALLLAVAVAGALAWALRRHRRRLAQQQQAQEKVLLTTQAVLRGQEEERRRVARDLHDGLGGLLATVKFYLGAARSRDALPAGPAQLLAQATGHLDAAVGELRRVARNLMPEALLAFGLAQALHDLCDATEQAGALRVQLQTYGLDARLAPAAEADVYRLVQELLTNVVKHARARQVLVQLMRHGPDLQLVVEDDGCGFDPAARPPGVGLRSVQARAQYLGGTAEVQSRPGQGTTVSLELRLPAEAVAGAALPAGAPTATASTTEPFTSK
ncbi:sensor histidine kinase [Hymenobacter nivis]|uniref:sensor histidine kinase n=1 Tax=Hymenobacter nivis TaxID=1850093 RepID=UPI00112640A9|nr:sensor histidine kinase [Hymenobacter nivis]